MSRGNLGLLLFREHMGAHPFSKSPIFMLGGTNVVWKREIGMYKGYELWSRLLSWDEKWMYALTSFVEKGRVKPKSYYLQKKQPPGAGEKEEKKKEIDSKVIYASAISRFVFKRGRKTVPPMEMLKSSGLLPADDDIEGLRKMEEIRLRRLGIAQLREGWDAVHDIFFEEIDEVLGRYTDFLFR